MGKVLGLDVGDRKIGVAVGDPESRLAFVRPAFLVEDWAEIWEPLNALIASEQATELVIGLPRNADGTEGPQAARVHEFVDELRTHVDLPILFRDEYGTSQAVQREQAGQKLARGEEDSLAAQLVVEAYLQETIE